MGKSRFTVCVVFMLGASTGLAQQASTDSSSAPKAQLLSLSGRSAGGGSVKAQQSSSGSGGGASVDTFTSSVDISGVYEGSTPDPERPLAPLSLTIADAIGRGLRFNLGAVSASASVTQSRGERLAAISQLLPNITATLAETGARTNLQSLGFSSNMFGSAPLPSAVGPFQFYAAHANVSQSFSVTSIYNIRQAQSSLEAARMSAFDARELIVFAVGGTYLRALASKANIRSQEAQVKQSQATFEQSNNQFTAGTKPVIDRNRSFVELRTQQQRLTSLRGDLAKQLMQLARLIGLSPGQTLVLSDELPTHVPAVAPIEEAVRVALADRSDLAAARLQLKAAREARRASLAEYLPYVGFSGYYGVEGVNPEHGVQVFTASGTLTVPLFQGLRVPADVEQANAALRRREAEYADQKGVVELDVREAYVDLGVAIEQIAVAQENRKVAGETLTQSLDRFASGVTNSVEVVQSQETVATAERDYVSSLFSLNLARLSLARATGQAERFIPQMLKEVERLP